MQKYQLFRVVIKINMNFLIRKDLKYKPDALDKARFQFSPLGQTFSIGLDKTAQGYQEEGVMKLLKDVRDILRGVRLPGPDDNDNDDNDNDNDDNDDNDDDDDNKVIIKNLLNEINKINNINKQHNDTINNINKKK